MTVITGRRRVGKTILALESAKSAKHPPINTKPGGRLQKYYLRDNFLSFWFRFIYRNLPAVETDNFGYVCEVIGCDYATWSVKILERFFRDLYASCGKYKRIGSYWERGNKN